MAVTNVEERLFCSLGLVDIMPVQFQACQSIPFGGVMLLLPFLLECGLLTYRNHYQQRKRGYYNFDGLFILMAFMLLCRIKSFEQIKHYNPGDWGKLMGSDRIPEVKKMRGLVHEVTDQKKCSEWSASLSEDWIKKEQAELFYIDGHVQVYHGYLANPGLKHVSRQRLCLPGMMEFWVNSATSMPFFFITAQVNEKMIEMLNQELVPKLLSLHTISDDLKKKMDQNDQYPRFTLVFDREGYSPAFFSQLWNDHRIAIITYRKNVKDQWNETLFVEQEVECSMGKTKMLLHQQEISLKGDYQLREVRKRSTDGHQISIVTTNRVLTIVQIAAYMFGRWVQENFFRYMRQEYAMDKITQYAIGQVDDDIMVVNREYSNKTYRIKQVREKITRRKAKLYQHTNQSPKDLDVEHKEMIKWMKVQFELKEDIEKIELELENLKKERSQIPYKIPVSKMPQESRYTIIDQESKYLQNIVKMICYRAETAFASLLTPVFSRSEEEVRALVKSIIMRNIDLYPDTENNKLIITLYPLSNNRSMEAVEKVIDAINKTETKYPGTDLVLFYKMTTI